MENHDKSTFERDYKLVRNSLLLALLPKWLQNFLFWLLMIWIGSMAYMMISEAGKDNVKILFVDVLWNGIIVQVLKVILIPILYVLGFNLE